MRPSRLALLAVVVMAACPRLAAAQTAPKPPPPAPASAIDHFTEAVGLFERGETGPACRKFEQSYAEDAAPGTLYNMAVCHEREGRITDAYRELDDLASRAEAAHRTDKAASVRQRANALLPKLARIDLVHRSDARAGVTGLFIDRTAFVATVAAKPIYLAPGQHVIVIQHADGTSVTRTTSRLHAGGSERIEMEDPAPPATEPSRLQVVTQTIEVDPTRRAAAYIAGGAGVALVAAGAFFGISALSKKSDLQTICPANVCLLQTSVPAANTERSAAHTDETLSTVGFLAGGAAIAGAVYLFFSSRESKETVISRLEVLPASDGHGAGALVRCSF